MSKHYANEFHAKVPPSKPMMKGGHQPGIKVGNDRAPESHLEKYPPGTAPREFSFRPDTTGQIPGQALNPDADLYGRTEALDMPGATSADVYAGPGRPLQGMEGRDVAAQLPGKKHTGERTHPYGHKKEETGLVGVGANAGPDPVRQHGWDLPEGVEKGMKAKESEDWPRAEGREPVNAEQVASGRRYYTSPYD